MVAASTTGVIGRDGGLPWRLPEDLRRFRALTLRHPLLVGRRTHEAILRQVGGPLAGRFTVVVSTAPALPGPAGPVVVVPDVVQGLRLAVAVAEFCGLDEVFVAGGASVYEQALPATDRVYLTRVLDDEIDGDVRMPEGWLDGFRRTGPSERGSFAGLGYAFEQYDRV